MTTRKQKSAVKRIWRKDDWTRRQGLKIREVRERHMLTQIELCERLQIRQPVLSRVESGKTCPTTAYLRRIARALGCNITDLLPPDEE